MIASYKDVKRRPCDKCLKLFDKRMALPVIRNVKPSTHPADEREMLWEAMHAACT